MPNTLQEYPHNAENIQRAAVAGLIVNVLLTVFKGVAGVHAGSRALVADAVHSLSDLATDVAVIVGARFWCRPPDETHPMGHKGIETVVSLFIGLMLVATGAGIAVDSLKTLSSHSSSVKPDLFAVVVAAVSLISKEMLFRWTLRKAENTGSGALAANAWHHRSDGISSIPVLVAVSAPMISRSMSFLDSVGGAVVSIFIVRAGWKVLQPVIGEVTNSAPPARVVNKMMSAARGVSGVISIHRFRARMQGGGIYVDLHVQVSGDNTVYQGYSIGKEIEKTIMSSDSSVRDVIARIEPFSSCGDADNCEECGR